MKRSDAVELIAKHIRYWQGHKDTMAVASSALDIIELENMVKEWDPETPSGKNEDDPNDPDRYCGAV